MCYLTCPRCGFTAEARGRESAIGRCPRCARVARRPVAMEPARPGELTLRRTFARGGGQTLALSGELDARSAPHLEASVLELCAHGERELTLQLSGLTFIDSRGVHAMLLSRKRCEGYGCALSMVNGNVPVTQLSELAGFGAAPPLVAVGA